MILSFFLKSVSCIYIILQEYEFAWPGVWTQKKYRSLWPTFHGHWLCITTWIQFDVWTSYFSIMGHYHTSFDLKINVGLCDLSFLSYIPNAIWCMSIIFSDNGTVRPKLWPHSKYKSTWPIFHDLVIHLLDYLIDKQQSWYNSSMWHTRLALSSICISVTYILWSSDFAS